MSEKNVNKVIYDGETLVDLTKDTVSPQTLAEGVTAHDASGESIVGVAAKGVYYIQGSGSTAGTWLGEHPGITELIDGLTIAYKVGIAGASSTTLNINGLGAKKVVRNVNTAVTTNYGVNSVVILTYTVDSGTGYWKISDYDSDTKTRSSNKADAKMFLIGATAQSTSGQTTYSNANCYIGADNCLYSGGKKVSTKDYDYPTPLDYGAKGDGSTDDTAAFQNALAANRVVFVPGGTYKLSDELTIDNNSCLELSQDTVLEFSQTSGNCISLKMMSWIKGNHASVKVPYAFTGNVINSSTSMISSLYDIPAFKHWDPQWKPGKYITDLNILKPASNGLHYSIDGTCNGTGIYLYANGDDRPSNFMMGIDFSGLRIAGAFSYGVRSVVENAEGDSGFNFDMRLDGFIESCETGVLLEGNINPVLSFVVQPQKCQPINNVRYPYAKVGIKLVNTINANLMGSSVWDWDSDKTLWKEGNENQHLVMLGDCYGAILNERYYWSNPNYDIRNLIYTDTPSNLEKLVIINEPFTRWFKPVDMEPYFDNGETIRKLALREELDEIAAVDRLPNFTNVLPTAIDKTGAIFEGTGFVRYGMRWGNGNATLYTDEPYLGCTGLIPIKSGDRIYVDGIKLIYGSNTTPNVVVFKSDFSYAHHATAGNITAQTWYFGYQETEAGFIVDMKSPLFSEKSAAYVAFSFDRNAIGAKPMISINNPISYTVTGVLADGIKVKPENVDGLSEMLGSYINDVDVLIGG